MVAFANTKGGNVCIGIRKPALIPDSDTNGNEFGRFSQNLVKQLPGYSIDFSSVIFPLPFENDNGLDMNNVTDDTEKVTEPAEKDTEKVK